MNMDGYVGVIIEESLENKDVLKRVKIVSTKVEEVKEQHQTPWLSQWTLHTVEVTKGEAQAVALEISKSLDRAHGGSWYADFKNGDFHFIIFPDRVFQIERSSKAQYDEARSYGLELGIPEHQVDFHPEVKGWER